MTFVRSVVNIITDYHGLICPLHVGLLSSVFRNFWLSNKERFKSSAKGLVAETF